MIFQLDPQKLALFGEALRDRRQPRRLLPKDCAVFLMVLRYTNPRSGKSKVTQRQLALDLDVPESSISLSIKRLRREKLLARGHDKVSGDRYFLVNPYLCSTGGHQQRGHLWQLFQEAME